MNDANSAPWTEAAKEHARARKRLQERLDEQKKQHEVEMLTATLERLSKQNDAMQRHFGLKEYVEKATSKLDPEARGDPYRDRMLRRCPECRAVITDEDVEEHALWHENESNRLLAIAVDMMQVLANLEKTDE